jgi:alpha-tubulin suppressor-like RCC1 family protein
MVSAGYGHTLVLSEKGDIYSFGLNIKGQLGLGDRKTRLVPTLLKRFIFIYFL